MAATVARPRPRGGERLLDVDGLRTPGAGAQASDAFPDPASTPRYDADYQRLLKAMGDAPVSLNTLVDRTELTVEAVSSMLLVLELDGVVASASSGLFMRLSSAH